jgi:hypothetical protein
VIVTLHLPPLDPIVLDSAKPPEGVSRVAWCNRLRAVARQYARQDNQVVYTLAQLRVLTPEDAARVLQHFLTEHWRDGSGIDVPRVEALRQVVEDYVTNYVPPPPRVKTLWDLVLARGW